MNTLSRRKLIGLYNVYIGPTISSDNNRVVEVKNGDITVKNKIISNPMVILNNTNNKFNNQDTIYDIKRNKFYYISNILKEGNIVIPSEVSIDDRKNKITFDSANRAKYKLENGCILQLDSGYHYASITLFSKENREIKKEWTKKIEVDESSNKNNTDSIKTIFFDHITQIMRYVYILISDMRYGIGITHMKGLDNLLIHMGLLSEFASINIYKGYEDPKELSKSCAMLADNKGSDYTGDSDALKNFVWLPQETYNSTTMTAYDFSNIMMGSLYRMGDKRGRLITLMNKERKVKDETVQETIRDLYNYTLLTRAILMRIKPFSNYKDPSGGNND